MDEMEGVFLRPDGDANFYHLLRHEKDGSLNWVAKIQMNGELTVAQQDRILQRLTLGTLGIFLLRQIKWSKRTFGTTKRTMGILKHILKEVDEVIAKPDDLMEWIDIIILGLDGFWRHGGSPSTIGPLLNAKAEDNYQRRYPFPTSDDEPSEHIRETGPTLAEVNARRGH